MSCLGNPCVPSGTGPSGWASAATSRRHCRGSVAAAPTAAVGEPAVKPDHRACWEPSVHAVPQQVEVRLDSPSSRFTIPGPAGKVLFNADLRSLLPAESDSLVPCAPAAVCSSPGDGRRYRVERYATGAVAAMLAVLVPVIRGQGAALRREIEGQGTSLRRESRSTGRVCVARSRGKGHVARSTRSEPTWPKCVAIFTY